MTGLTRAAAAQIIAGYFNTTATHVGGGYDTYTVRDDRNRQWKLVSDSSIRCQGRGTRAAGRQYAVEFVSPICQYADSVSMRILKPYRNWYANCVREARKSTTPVDCTSTLIHLPTHRKHCVILSTSWLRKRICSTKPCRWMWNGSITARKQIRDFWRNSTTSARLPCRLWKKCGTTGGEADIFIMMTAAIMRSIFIVSFQKER